MKNGFLNGLKCILRDKDFNTSLLAPAVQAFGFQCPLHKQPSGSSPFCTYISLYLVYGNVLCMIQTLIYINSCNTVKVTQKTSR